MSQHLITAALMASEYPMVQKKSKPSFKEHGTFY